MKKFSDLLKNQYTLSDYTNDLLMADYRLLPQLIQAVVELNYFGTGIDYSNFDSAETILDIFFKLRHQHNVAEILIHHKHPILIVDNHLCPAAEILKGVFGG